ncbi:ATP-binding cassette domain-containing protein [Streptomyces sp. NPDC026672]|uniref:ABC transporter ATP-binding protein n=1 Tax=unclassified Streptomyces TaxID=2593676 RepID=UPI0033D53511
MRHDLRLAGVGRRYGPRGPWVLRGVDLTVRPGTLTRIQGAAGTGKSTLLRLVAGLDTPTEGRITGRPRTAYVPERFPTALPFTPSAQLTRLGAALGLSLPTAARRAAEWLERFGAQVHAATPIARLSRAGGQRVAVAQALCVEPDLLVLDEAWTGLDADTGAELERAVAERTVEGGAVVFVDRDPRRLAGAPDATYTVTGGALDRRTGEAGAAGVPLVLVEARRPAGGRLPAGLVRTVVAEEGTPGVHRLTVPASHSDILLRALLTSRPPWHVVGVRPYDG